MKTLTDISVRVIRCMGRFVLFALIMLAFSTQADDLRELLIGQGAVVEGNKLTLSRNIDVSVAKLSLHYVNPNTPINIPTLTIDLAGHDLCVEAQGFDKNYGESVAGASMISSGGRGTAFQWNVVVTNSNVSTAHAYFPYEFSEYFWSYSEPGSGSVVMIFHIDSVAASMAVGGNVVFGPSYFQVDDHNLTETKYLYNKKITFGPGACYDWEEDFDGGSFENIIPRKGNAQPAFRFMRGSHVSGAIRDYILSGAGSWWISDLDVVSPTADDEGLYEIVARAPSIQLLDWNNFSYWPWKNRLGWGYRPVGLESDTTYRLVLKLSSLGTDYVLLDKLSSQESSWFTETEHAYTISTLICGAGHYDPNATLKAELLKVDGGAETLISQAAQSGILIDNRETYLMKVGESRPVAYSLCGFDGAIVHYRCAITNSLDGGTPTEFGYFSYFLGDRTYGTKIWTPTTTGTYTFTHVCSTETKTATIIVAENFVDIPVAAKDFIYDGTEKIGVPEGTGYTLSGTWKATAKGTYSATATLSPGSVWSDGTSAAKTFTWSIAGASISGLTATLDLPPGGYTYDGNPKTPTVTIQGLTEGKDFTVTYQNNVLNGQAMVIIQGIGDYTGVIAKSFVIGAKIAHTPPLLTLTYTGEEQIGVAAGEGYTVTGTDRATNVGSYTAEIRLLPGYVWATEDLLDPDADPELTYFIYTWGIHRKSLWDLASTNGWLTAILSSRSFVYDGTEKKPTVNLHDLIEGRDYTVTYYGDCTNATSNAVGNEPYVEILGTGNYSQGINAYYTITRAAIYDQNYTTTPPIYVNYLYDGKAKQSTITVIGVTADVGQTLVEGKDFEVTHGPNVLPTTSAWTRLTGLGNYDGSTKWTFTISGRPLSNEMTVTLDQNSFVYDGTAKCPGVTIDGLTEGVDYTVLYKNNVAAGTATVIITGAGGYTGTIEKTFTITPTTLSAAGITASLTETSFVYTGGKIKPEVDIDLPTKFYTVTYQNNVNAGKGKAIITGTGNYSGTLELEFNITPSPISNWPITLTPSSLVYTGSACEPTVKIAGLTSDDFEVVSYANNVNAGTATVTIAGKGNCIGTTTKTFEIKRATIGGKTVTLDPSSGFVRDGKAKTPTVTVVDGGRTLQQNTDFTVAYQNNVNAGTATVVIEGRGNYANTTNVSFRIAGATIEGMSATLSQSAYTYDGNAKTPGVTVGDLTEGTDYTVAYSGNVAAGTATATITGIGNYAGTITKTFTINKASLSGKTAVVTPATVTYNRSAQTPAVTIAGLEEGRDFTVEYANNTNQGTASVTVKGIGNYEGTLNTSFTIAKDTLTGKTVTLSPTTYAYNGTARQPTVTVEGLTSVTDYTVAYANNTAAGMATVTITGKGNYEGVVTRNFTITLRDISSTALSQVTLEPASYTYSGSACEPTVSVTGLTKDTDYTVSYANNTAAGTASVILTGIGNNSGTLTKTFTIAKKTIVAPTAATGLAYTGSPLMGVVDSADKAWYTLSGVYTATAFGNYTAYANLNDKANTQWSGGGNAQKTLSWSIAAAAVDEEGAYTPADQSALEALLPQAVNDGTLLVKPGFSPVSWPEGYLVREVKSGVYEVSKVATSEPLQFTLDTRLEREVTTSDTETFTHSADAWGDASGSTATISITRNGESRGNLGTYTEAQTATWTPSADGRYVFTHSPGSNLTATFVVSGLGPEGSGTSSDPYLVHDKAEFDAALTHGTAPVYIQLMADIGEQLTATKSVSLDLNGHTISGGDDGAGHGLSGYVVSSGTTTFTGTGTIIGGSGSIQGANAVTGSYSKADTVTLINGVSGEGTKTNPYKVASAAEFVAAVGAGTEEPIWIEITANIAETITVTENKSTVVDLKGHTITGGAGQPGIDYQGVADLTLTNSVAQAGGVVGGNGANGAPGAAGGAGVKLNGGSLTVEENVSVTGGNGGNATSGSGAAGGAGGAGVEGVLAHNDGTVTGGNGGLSDTIADAPGGEPFTAGTEPIPGNGTETKGKTGDGTQAHPYVVYSAAELEALTAATAAGNAIWLKLGADIGPASLVGTVNIHLDLNGHDIQGGTNPTTHNGIDALTVATGAGTLELSGLGTVKGGDGLTAIGYALVINDASRVTKAATVSLVNGQCGDGSSSNPYQVSSREQLEQLLKSDTTHVPVSFKLTDDLEGTVTLGKSAVIDLNGHDITSGADYTGAGKPSINVTAGDLTVTDSSSGTKGKVLGGNGTNGGNGASGVVIASGTVTVAGGATVKGGNGGDNLTGAAGAGAAGVTGSSTTMTGGTIVDGTKGVQGNGTEANPYVVYSAAELAAVVAAHDGETVYAKLGAKIGAATIAGAKSLSLDLNGFDIDARTDSTVATGAAGLAFTSTGTLALTGTGTVYGQDGTTAGGKAVSIADASKLSKDASVTLVDGQTGNGSSTNPYQVSSREQLEKLLENATAPVYFELTDNLTGPITIDENKNVVIDLKGHNIAGTTDYKGDGTVAINVTGTGNLTITDSNSSPKGQVLGGNGTNGGNGASGVVIASGTVTVADGTTVKGGNGGDNLSGAAGAGAAGVTGSSKTTTGGTIVDGVKGVEGAGTEANPYVVYSAAELAAVVAAHDGETVYAKLGAKIGAATIDGTKNLSLDLNGFDVDARTDTTVATGAAGLAFTSTGTLALTGTGTVYGQNGTTAGGKAVSIADASKLTKGTKVTFVDGQTGDGSSTNPYEVSSREQLEQLLNSDTTHVPVYFKLTDDLEGTVTLGKSAVIDLNGHDITAGSDYKGDGLPAVNVTAGDLTVTDSSSGTKGKVLGGNGENGGNGASGVVIASPGAVTVDGGATVKGGNGGDNLNGPGGTGAAGVTGATPTLTDGGTVVKGTDGVQGDGTAAHPFVASNADELEAIVNEQEPGTNVYVRLTGEIERGVTLDGDVHAHIDLNGHNISGRNGTAGADGEDAITLGAGPGSLELSGNGDVIGGNGGDNFGGTAGQGGDAIVREPGAPTVTQGANVRLFDGEDGANGDGTVTYPYLVASAAELEQVIADHTNATPVYVKLIADIGGVSLTESKNVSIDLNGHDIVGGKVGEDGQPGIQVYANITVNLTNSGAEKATVQGGDGRNGGAAVNGVTPTVGANIELKAGKSGSGTAEYPFVVYTAEELAQTVSEILSGNDVWVKLGADIGAATVKGDVNLYLDLNGYDIRATGGDASGDGLPGLAVGAGTGTLTLTNSNDEAESVIAGADATGKGGLGGAAVEMAGDREPTVGAGVRLVDGMSGTGAADDPFLVHDKVEFERALEKGVSPVYITLVDDIGETLPIDENKDVVLDLNGHDVTGGTDASGNGLAGIEVTGSGNLTITGAGNVSGGDGNDSPAGTAGNGGTGVVMNGGELSVGSDVFVMGGDGGNTEEGTPGTGGKGTLPAMAEQPDNIIDGKDGSSSVADLLKGIFGDKIEVETLPGGGHRVTLTGDLTGPVSIPDSIGTLEIDLNGYDITGPNGGPGADGQPAVIVTKTNKAETPAAISFVGEGNVTGGNGGDSTTGNGGNGGAGILFEDGANAAVEIGEDVTVTGGNGGAGGYSESDKAGNGGKGGDSISAPDKAIDCDGTRQGGAGGNGGDTGDGKSGSGGLGGDFGLDSEGEAGKTGVTEGGKTALLEYLFGGEENVEVTKEDGVYRVTLLRDLDGTITIPDSFGSIIVDLNAHTITGPNGTEQVLDGQDVDPNGQPAVRIENTGKGAGTTSIQFVDDSSKGGGQLIGGNGANNPIGTGAPGLLVDDGTPVDVDVDEAEVTVTDGRNGGALFTLDAVTTSYPWTNTIAFAYTLDGSAAGQNVLITLADPGSGNVYTGVTFAAAADLTSGSHTLVWDAGTDCHAVVATNAIVRMALYPTGATPKDVSWQEDGVVMSVADLRSGTEENPRVINSIDDLLPIVFEQGATVVEGSAEGSTVLTNNAATAGTLEWTPSADGKLSLTKTANAVTETAWFSIAEGVSGKPKLTIPVVFDETPGAEPEQVTIPRTWLDEQFKPEEIAGKTDEQVKEMLQTPDANGLPKWQNKAIGWTGQKPAVNDIATVSKSNQLHINGFGGEAMTITCTIPDVVAVFVLKKLVHVEGGVKTMGTDLENDVWEDVPGMVSDTASFDLDLTGGDPTGFYRIFLRFESVK